MKDKEDLISALQQMNEADNLQRESLDAGNQNLAEAQEKIDELERKSKPMKAISRVRAVKINACWKTMKKCLTKF